MTRPGLFQDIIGLTAEHSVLVLISMAFALAVGIPLGILLTRRAALRGFCWRTDFPASASPYPWAVLSVTDKNTESRQRS